MKLGTKGRYAVMALVDLAHQSATQPVALVDIAQRQSISLQYLEQLFVKLRKAGIVSSVRGKQGGYLLARPVVDIKILDILVAADEPLKSTRCNSTQEKACIEGKRQCNTHNLWSGLERVINDYFGSISLADIAEQRVMSNGNIRSCAA
jgi:Rrf2 family iron-sulfur cluster assembly transcriptional regulator